MQNSSKVSISSSEKKKKRKERGKDDGNAKRRDELKCGKK